MRVALISERAVSTDGWGRYTVELARALRDRGVEPVLVTHGGDVDPRVREIEHHAVMPAAFGPRLTLLRHFLSAGAVKHILRSCAVAHNIVEPYLPLVAHCLGFRGQPLVQTAHGTWAVRPFASARVRLIHRHALRRVSLLVLQSRYTRDRMSERVDLPRHVVMPAGVTVEEFQTPAIAVPLPEWTRDATILLCVGGLKSRKGFHVAVNALARARHEVPHLRLAIVGGGSRTSTYERSLREQIAALGVGDAVHLVGRVDSDVLRAWFRRADIFVFPSVNDGLSFEGLGLACLEAAASGVPAIASRDCGVEDVVVDGSTGVLVAQGDADALATAVTRLATDETTRSAMGRRAREHAERLSWGRLADAMVKEYRRMTDDAAAR